MNSIQGLPFSFFFIDDLLPDCFGQKKGMTFRSLLTNEPTTNKMTYEGIRQDFQNLHAEFEAFEDFYKKLKTITNRDDFFTPQIMGRNKKTHTRGNNLFELVFSQDGRMDVSIIQIDGIKCVLILDVRISRHYDKSDNTIHAKNDALACRILSALDEREVIKSKNVIETDTAFRNGLIAYQNEILHTINTNEAKFEILLNTLDTILFSNKGIEAKKSIFFDTLFDIMQDLNATDQHKFETFVEQQLTSNNIKQYHKELLHTLWYFNQFDENEKNDLSHRFNKIKIAKTFARSFLNQTIGLLENDMFRPADTVKMYRIFNKIPTSYLYVLQDEFEDTGMNMPSGINISALSARKQISLFLEQLTHLKTNGLNEIFPRFKQLCEDCYREKMDTPKPIENKVSASNRTVDDILYISMNHLDQKETIKTIANTLMHVLIKKNPSMHSLIDKPENEHILNNPDSLGYHWFNGRSNNETLLNAINRLIFTPNKHIEKMICEQYPFLANYIAGFRQNKNVPDTKLHTIYTSLKNHSTEEEFDNIYRELKTLSEHEQKVLHSYFSSDYIQTSEDIDIGGHILGSFELITMENAQKQKQKQTKTEKPTTETNNEKSVNKQIRQNFINAFNAFLNDVDNKDKKQSLEQTVIELTEPVLNGLKTLPKNDVMGIFIRDYIQEKGHQSVLDTAIPAIKRVTEMFRNTPQSAFDTALIPVILNARENKKTRLFDSIQAFFANPKQSKNNQKLKEICASLSEQDFIYITGIFEQNSSSFKNEKMFINLYQQHISKDFEEILNTIQNEQSLSLAHEREKRIIQYETTLNIALFSSDEKATEYLTTACQALTKDDIKFALSERDINIPAKILLQKIANIVGQNTPSQSEKIKTQIESVRKMTDFQNTFAKFVGNYNDKKTIDTLIEKYLQLPASDLEIFVNLNRQEPFIATFFEKLLKNKRKYSDPAKQKEGALGVIESTIKKLKFHRGVITFMHQTQKNANEQFVDHFLSLTQNGYTEYSEIMSENKDNTLLTYFLREMKQCRKETSPKQEKQSLCEFVEANKWLVDFYQSVQMTSKAYQEALKICQSNPAPENTAELNTIRSFIQLQISDLDLVQCSTILGAHIFANDPTARGEILKHGFCMSVNNHKKKPAEKVFYMSIMAFCAEMDDKHYDEIINEPDQSKEVTSMIQDLRQYFNGDSLERAKRRLGISAFLERTARFLLSQTKQRISYQEGFQQCLLDDIINLRS